MSPRRKTLLELRDVYGVPVTRFVLYGIHLGERPILWGNRLFLRDHAAEASGGPAVCREGLVRDEHRERVVDALGAFFIPGSLGSLEAFERDRAGGS